MTNSLDNVEKSLKFKKLMVDLATLVGGIVALIALANAIMPIISNFILVLFG